MEMYTREEQQTEVKDDPKARELLQQAFEQTSRWQPDFSGFQADLCINVNGKETRGTVVVKNSKDVTVSLPEESADLQKWGQDQISMIAVHRGPRKFEDWMGNTLLP